MIIYAQRKEEEHRTMSIAIVVHGGAGNIDPARVETAEQGCKEAALLGWHVLQAGGSALEAVETAVQALENNPNYNAGTGACLTSDGRIELDAGVMEGSSLNVGAIAGVELIKNPIALARKVFDSEHVLLVGKGAQLFAQEQGIALCTLEELITERQYAHWKRAQAARAEQQSSQSRHGTVGAVALDSAGVLASATSTGGMHNKRPGRVGDSPLVGSGFYADEHAAISCTGDGEDFTRLLIAKRAADFVAAGMQARDAAQAAIAVLGAKARGTGGLIIVDHQSNVGFAWNSAQMAHAYLYGDMQEPSAGV
jgi:beta-aspartyl-peptidase (threonine type)